MRTYLVLETRYHHKKEWAPSTHMTSDDSLGSLSSNPATGREVYLFGWVDGIPGVWQSLGGAAVEFGMARAVMTEELTLLSDLEVPFKLKIFDARGNPIYLRFSLSHDYPKGSQPAPKIMPQTTVQ